MKASILFLVALCWAMTPSICDACACCGEPGGWGIWNQPMAEFLESSGQGPALMAATICGRIDMGDTIDGLALRDSVVLAFQGSSFEVCNARGGHIIARINLDGDVERFAVDTGESDLYYTEWRFRGAVEADDSLHTYWLGSHATIVIQGRQNACFQPELIKHWVARFDGPGFMQADVRAYGTVAMEFQ